MLADLRIAVRQLLKSPGFTAVAVLTLALGIGACTAMFSVIDAAMLRPMRALARDRLVVVWGTNAGLGIARFSQSVPNYFDLRDHANAFTGLAAVRGFSANVEAGDLAIRLEGNEVTANFIGLLGVRPAVGRDFTSADDRPGAPRVAIISGRCWREHLGADPAIVGRKIVVNGEPHEIVGVIEDSRGVRPADIWRPLAVQTQEAPRHVDCMLLVLGQLKPGVTISGAQSEMDALGAGIRAAHPEYRGWSLRLENLYDVLVHPEQQRALTLLFAAVGCVLLVACSNIANLLFSRALSREREIAVRLALGASRMQIVRQLLTEAALLAAIGTAGGILAAFWCADLLRSALPESLLGADRLAVGGASLAFAAVTCVVVTVLSGLAPALRGAQGRPGTALAGGSRTIGGTPQKIRLRSALVVAQFALSTVLLVGAGLLGRSFYRLQHTDPGFRTSGVMTFQISPRAARVPNQQARNAYFDDLTARLTVLPGVVRVGVSSLVPFAGGNTSNMVKPADASALPTDTSVQVNWRIASPEYFQTLGIPLLEGRAFTRADTGAGGAVLIISQRLARRLWPGESAVGKRVRPTPSEQIYTVVGVVGDIPLVDLSGDEEPAMFFSSAQWSWETMTIAVQSRVAPAILAPAIRGTLRQFDPGQPLFNFHTMDELVDGQLQSPRLNSTLLAIFAGLALVLAAVGIYGVMATSVVRRTNEIGVRMALGAQMMDILRLILGLGFRLALLGVALGLVGGFVAARALTSLLYQTTPSDPLVYGATASVLGAVALVACYLPARRATKIDPIVALRAE